MAEIHVQTKKQSSNSMWIWIVLALIIAGAVIYYLMTRNKTAENTAPPANTTGAVSSPAETFSAAAGHEQHRNTTMYRS